jgi:peptide/nickel transport system permease protein
VSASAPATAFFPGIVLPVIVLTMVMTAHILRTVRSSVIETLDSDYVQMARLKGVPYWRMVFRHVLPNALLPAINVVALTIAWLLGGVVVVEKVFNYPGLGHYMIDAISDRDLPVVQAIALILAAVYVGVNLAADMLTMVLNPRLRTLRARNG